MVDQAHSGRAAGSFGVRPGPSELAFRSDVAPWDVAGGLPPGMTEELVSRIVCAVSREAAVLSALGVKKKLGEPVRRALHRAFQSARHRRTPLPLLRNDERLTFPNFVALYVCRIDEPLYRRFFEGIHLPTDEHEDDAQLANAIRAFLSEADQWHLLHDELEGTPELVVMAAWSHALMMPSLAKLVLEPMAQRHPAVARWLGLRATDASDLGASPQIEPCADPEVDAATLSSNSVAALAEEGAAHESSSDHWIRLPTSSQPPDPFIDGTRPLLEEIAERQTALVTAIAQGRYDEFDGYRGALDRARGGLRERLANKAAEYGIEATELPEPAPPALASEGGLEQYLRTLQSRLARASARNKRRVDDAREKYLRELGALSLPPPKGLEEASTLHELERIRAADTNRVLDAQFRRSLRREGGVHGPARDHVEPRRRLEIYLEEALRPDADPEHVRTWFEVDEAARHVDPTTAAGDLLAAIHGWVRRRQALSKGLWSLVNALDRRVLLDSLASVELGSALACADPEAICGGELARVVGADTEKTGRALERLIRLVQSRDAEPPRRIELLAELLSEDPSDTRIATELLFALAAGQRHEQVWLLADALARARILMDVPDDLRPSLLAFLVERAEEDGGHHAILGDLVDIDDWVGDDVDAVTVLLFLAVVTNRGRVVLFRRTKQIANLQALRPCLFELWLRPRLERAPSRLDMPEIAASWSRGHQALLEWDREIQQRRLYQAWAYSEDYQRAIRPRLEIYFANVQAGKPDETFDPEKVLREVQLEHDLRKAEYPARGIIIDYMQEQVERANVIAMTLAECGTTLEELRRNASPPDRRMLEQEAQQERNRRGAIAEIYRYVLEAGR